VRRMGSGGKAVNDVFVGNIKRLMGADMSDPLTIKDAERVHTRVQADDRGKPTIALKGFLGEDQEDQLVTPE